jgi:uncharacterized protein
MDQQLIIDPLRFARERGQIRNTLNLAEMERLRDALYSSDNAVEYALSGELGDEALLRVEVSGSLILQCQRCLGPLHFRCAVDSTLIVAERGREIDDKLEWIPAEDRIDPMVLVEDEILLALPVAPRHPEGQCEVPAMGQRSPG